MSDDAASATSPIVANAIAFQKASESGFLAQRQREPLDLACQVPENLWPSDVKLARSGSMIGGINIPPRPMMSIDKLGQPVKLQMNQLRRAHLGVNISPIGKKANSETAKTLQGLYRAIERDSHANIGRCWGSDRALKCGLGWYRVNVVYDDTTDDPFDLTIRIQRLLRQGSVFPDPFAQEPDFSDGKRLLYVSFMAEDVYKSEHPKSKLASYNADDLTLLMDAAPFWFVGEDENRAICVAEYFYTEYRDREWIVLDDGSFSFADEIPDGRARHPEIGKTRTVKEPILKWAKINACEVLEETTWNGKYIPFVPCIGDELQPFDAERRWFGIYSTNKDSAHLFNVAVSNAVETAALEPKATWKGPVGSFKTNNKQWQLANVRNLPYLEYDPIIINGLMAPAPERETAQKNLGNNIALIEIADNNLQAGTAMYDALLGKSERDDPAKKVLALQDQSLASNSHWVANLADISMPYEAKIILDLIPRVFDRPGRVAQLVGEDNEEREVVLNHPFTEDDEKRAVPVPEWSEGMPVPKGAKYYDVTSGTYSVAVTIGKSYPTRAKEGADGFSQMIQAAPEYMLPRVGDIWMGFQEFPGKELAAKRLKAGLPPELANVDNEDGKPDPRALQMELQKAQQGAQMMQHLIQEQQKAIETDQIKAQADLQRVELDLKGKIELEQVKSQLAITLQQMKDEHALALKRLEFAHEDADREDTQAHEVAMEAAGAAHEEHESVRAEQHQANLGRQAHESKTLTGEQAHAQSLEAGERSHEQGMESQSQAESAAEKQAKLKPTPKAGE